MPEEVTQPTPETTQPTEPVVEKNWYGPYAIEAEQVNDTTPHGKITLIFEEVEDKDGVKSRPPSVTLDPEMYNASVTKEKSDLSVLRHKRITLVVGEILGVLLKRNIKLSEYEFMIALLGQSINDSISQSNKILWGGQDEQDRTMEDVDKVLKGIKKLS